MTLVDEGLHKQPERNPAHFEELRQYLENAVEQLLDEMQDQSVAYAVPKNDVLALIRAVARRQDTSPWAVWESWDARHQIPIETLVGRARRLHQNSGEALSKEEVAALRKRLLDKLGYVVLALVMCEEKR